MENTNTGKKTTGSYQKYRIRLIQYSIALNNIKIPTQAICILITIQALQLISMGVISPLSFQSFGLEYFQFVARVLYPDYYLRDTQLILYIIPITFIISLVHILIFLYTLKYQSRLRIIVLYLFLLFNTIILIPFLHANVSILPCYSTSPFSHNFTCYEGSHIVYLMLACVNIIWSIFCIFFVFALCTKNDPLSTDFYATSFSLWILAKFLLKISPIIYINVDPNLKFGVLYTVSFAGINLVYFVAFKLMWPQHRNCERIQNFVIRAEMITIFVSSFLISLHFFKNDPMNISFVLSWILGLIFSQIIIEIFRFKKERLINIYLQSNNQEQQVDQQTYIKFFYTLIYKIEQTSADQIQISHILKLHQLHCAAQECCCHQISKIYGVFDSENKLDKELIYRFVKCLIKQACAKLKKNNVSLVIASAYISYFRLNEKIISVNHVSQLLKSNKITLSQEISIRRLFSDLKSLDKSQTDLNKYIEFSQNLWNFQRQAEAAAENCKKYWNYLIEQDCSPSKVWKLANLVQNDKERLHKIMSNKLLSIFPNNLHALRVYSELLILIYRAPPDSIKEYLQTYGIASSRLKENLNTQEELLFRQNEQITVMCAAEFEGIFEFLRVSSNINNILNLRNIDLIHKNINTILPEIYQEFHDQKVKQYFNSNDKIIKQRTSKVLLIAKEGNIVNCYYKAKIISSMDHGLELVCFLRKNKPEKNDRSRSYYLMYYFKKGSIQQDCQYKNGDILHIEPELKSILFPPENEKDDTYVTKVEEVLPEWNIQRERMIVNGDLNHNNKIHKIEIDHEDELDCGVVIKYLKVEVRRDKSRFTLQQFQTEFGGDTKKATQLIMKNVSYAETSQSRLIVTYDHDSIKQGKKNGRQGHPIPISKLIINGMTLILIGIVIILCVIPFKVSPSYLTVQTQDFEMLEVISELGFSIFESSLKIQKNLDPSLYDNITSEIDIKDFDILNSRTKIIYDFLGLQSIDSSINVLIKIFQNNVLIQLSTSTINNAVSFLSNTLSQLLQNLDDQSLKSNLYLNLQQAYESIDKLSNVCGIFISQKIQKIKSREIICSSIQFCIMFILLLAGVVRIIKISFLSQTTIQIYEKQMDTSRLKDFVSRCNLFVDKIRGIQDFNQNMNMQQIKLIFSQFEKYITRSNEKPKIEQDKENDKNQDQQQKLLDLRKKVSFYQKPSKLYYIALGSAVILGWFACKFSLKYQTLFSQVENLRVQNRTYINNCLQLNGDIQRLTFYLALNYSSPEFDRSLSTVQNRLSSLTGLNEAKDLVDFRDLFQKLSELETKKQATTFKKIQEALNKGQSQLINYTHNLIKKQYQRSNSIRSPQIMAGQIIIGILAAIIFWRLMVIQQQIRIGCTLMLEMAKEGLGRDQYSEKMIKTTQTF